MKKIKVLLGATALVLLIVLNACSKIEVDDLEGEWAFYDGFDIDEERESVSYFRPRFSIMDSQIAWGDTRDHIAFAFELDGQYIIVKDGDLGLEGRHRVKLSHNVLDITWDSIEGNEETFFRVGSDEYYAHKEEATTEAEEALYEMFGEIWAWRAEVDEVVSEFEEVVIGFERRLEQEITAMLVGYTWRPYSSITGADFTETIYDEDATGVIFLEDGRAIFTGSDGLAPFVDYFEVQLVNPPRNSSGEDIYSFNMDLDESFTVTTQEGRIDWYDFERITKLNLIRDMSEESIENRLFLEELKLEIELITATTLDSLLEQNDDEANVGVRITIEGENSGLLFNIPSLSVLFTGDEFFSTNSLGGSNRNDVIHRRQPNDAKLIRELLNVIEAEVERQETVAEIMKDLVGTWVQFEVSDPSEWNPTGIMETQFVISCSADFDDCSTVHNHYAVINYDERERMMWSQGHDLSSLYLSDDLRYLNQMNAVFRSSASTSEFSINGNVLQLNPISLYGMTDVTYLNTNGEDIRLEGTLYTGDEVQKWTDFAFHLAGNTDENIYVKDVEASPVTWVRQGSTEYLEQLQESLNWLND